MRKLANAYLDGARLNRARLDEAQFFGAYLSRTQFRGANLTDVDLSGVQATTHGCCVELRKAILCPHHAAQLPVDESGLLSHRSFGFAAAWLMGDVHCACSVHPASGDHSMRRVPVMLAAIAIAAATAVPAHADVLTATPATINGAVIVTSPPPDGAPPGVSPDVFYHADTKTYPADHRQSADPVHLS
jgi:hypothetical protein